MKKTNQQKEGMSRQRSSCNSGPAGVSSQGKREEASNSYSAKTLSQANVLREEKDKIWGGTRSIPGWKQSMGWNRVAMKEKRNW